MMDQEIAHIPVMAQEVMASLNPHPGQVIVDCTIGMGGHAAGIAEKIGAKGLLIGIDRDLSSLDMARERLKEYPVKANFIQRDFRFIDHILDDLKIREVDGILYDLGISSYQLENPDRGFSIKMDGPLDMRMDRDNYISAYDLVNSLSETEISFILKHYGEERWHHRIARYLVRRREKNPIESTRDLSDTVLRAIPQRYRHQRIHPATRTFQAFRIAVNRELEALEISLNKSIPYLKNGGRLCVIAFHSLEDRIVKETFRRFRREGTITLINKKPMRPAEKEIDENPRARSARLRVAERIT